MRYAISSSVKAHYKLPHFVAINGVSHNKKRKYHTRKYEQNEIKRQNFQHNLETVKQQT
ncbi:hypothetical protein [Gardnerella pickettii]|uniref:hypothetical protein n=1 Tax=Gardnerella pickettii TaxID=2914924 RepID=UPI0015E1438C|nr:hypothetical protein [Gardnerella pickettii]